MYAQQNDDVQSFRRGEHIIPANYAGNAFTLEEEPCIKEENLYDTESEPSVCEACDGGNPTAPYEKAACTNAVNEKKQEHGFLSGILSRFSRGFELDDILLIGLIILLLQNDCESRDETVILLALLLLVGF